MDKPPVVSTETERWRKFGRFIRNYREDHTPLSQTDAARKAEMTRQQWNRIEKGQSGSKRPTIIKIAEALEADPVVFLNQAGFQESAGEAEIFTQTACNELEIHRLTRYYVELPRECQLDFLALAESLWRRRRAQGRAEKQAGRSAGKHSPQTVKPGVERKRNDRKVG